MTKAKSSKAAVSEHFWEIAAPVMDRLVNFGKYHAGNPLRSFISRKDINQMLGNDDPATHRNAFEYLMYGLAELIPEMETEEGTNAAKVYDALKYRNVELNKRFPSSQTLFLIAYNPKAQVASVVPYGLEQHKLKSHYSVKLVDSSGDMVPDFAYDNRIPQRGMTFVYNTDTEEWSLLRMRTGWAEQSKLGDAICDWSVEGRTPIQSDMTSVTAHLDHVKHVFHLVRAMEDETSLLFTELAVGCTLTSIIGQPVFLHDRDALKAFMMTRPFDWSNIESALRRLFDEDTIEAVLTFTPISTPAYINELGRIRFLTEANLSEVLSGEDEDKTITLEDVEREGSFILIHEHSIDIYNEAIREWFYVKAPELAREAVTANTLRWKKQPVAKVAEPEQPTKPQTLGDAIDAVNEKLHTNQLHALMVRKVILTKVLQHYNVPVTLLNEMEVATLNGYTDQFFAQSRIGSAYALMRDNFFPGLSHKIHTEGCVYGKLDEERVPGIMIVRTIEGTTEAEVTIWECDKDELRTQRVELQLVINTLVMAQQSGSLLVKFDDVVGFVDTEMRGSFDRIDNPNFTHDIYGYIKTYNDNAVMGIVNRREQLTRNIRQMEGVVSAPRAIGSEHDYHVQIASAVIGCLKDFGHSSIGTGQLNWVQEGLARKLFTSDEIGLGDEVLLHHEGRWFLAKEM